jgi:hypothetical protein
MAAIWSGMLYGESNSRTVSLKEDESHGTMNQPASEGGLDRQRSSRKLSRRRFGLLAAAPLAATAAAQDAARPADTPAAAPQRPVSPAIAQFDVPMATEPGFVFKP